MAKSFSYKYQLSSSDSNFPARVVLFDKPGKDCYIDRHWHKTIEINYVIRGDLNVTMEDEKFTLTPGEFSVINSNDAHNTVGKYENVQVRYLVIIFSYLFTKHYHQDFEKYRYVVDTPEKKDTLKSMLDSIVENVDSEDELSELHVLKALISILDFLFTKCAVERSLDEKMYEDLDDFDYAKIATEYINENYTQDIDLDMIAAKVGLSTAYFSRYFKLKTSKNFSAYLSDIRMEKTIADMINYGVNETTAALRNGFSSVKAFISTFKRNYNCTPSQYVKKNGSLPTVFVYNKNHEENRFI